MGEVSFCLLLKKSPVQLNNSVKHSSLSVLHVLSNYFFFYQKSCKELFICLYGQQMAHPFITAENQTGLFVMCK